MNRYSEEEAVQKPAGELLGQLGWNVIYCHDFEVLGNEGTLGRDSYTDVLLKRELRNALIELNPHLELEECEQAASKLELISATDSLKQINEKFYRMLRDGIPVERVMTDGTRRTELAQVFDFDNPVNNSYIIAEELWIKGAYHKRRCDIVGFVNGVPLLFIEFKRHDKDILRAYEDNYRDYLDTIPQLFYYNAFIMLSNGLESRVGTLGSPFEYFHEWKRLVEGDVGSVALPTMLHGICSKDTFLDLFENFILFDHSHTPAAKILARNHQFLGVNEAIIAYEDRRIREGKLGVFWHTQGSGKSYSMVFFAQKVRRKFAGSPTFLVVTDRDELNKQISETFEGCGCLGGAPRESLIATSGKNLLKKLKGNPSFIFSLIQKFNDSNATPITPEHDVIILSDEAHRSNNGIFFDNMHRVLPTASLLGFTGTPLFDYDHITSRTFGGYVSVYDFKRAVDDGATVPLYYENRSDQLGIENPELNERLAEAIEAADLDSDQMDKLERDLQRELHIMMSRPRLESIAQDFVRHYTEIWESGKAMFVCVNKVTAVMMFDLVQQFWQEAIENEERILRGLSQQEACEQQRKIDWMRSTEMAVVISQEQNEIAMFDKWGLDILTHRKNMNERNLDKEFKDSDNPLRIVFVCAMWLTGFDVKPLSVMYFDKPMKAHSLMQAIARANRVHEGKSNGLIVDYVGVVKALRKALADYTMDPQGSAGADPVVDKAALLMRIEESIADIVKYLNDRGFDISILLEAEGFDKIGLIKDAADAVSASDEIKKRFGIMARELFKLMKFAERGELENETKAHHSAINAIYNEVTKRRDVADTGDIMTQLQRIVDEHIVVTESSEELKRGTSFDISAIDFAKLGNEFKKTKRKHLLLDDLRVVIEERLQKALRINPRHVDYYQRYERIIDEYNAEQNKAAIEKVFQDLLRLSHELDEAQKSYIVEGFTNERQHAVFEMLFQETLSKSEIKQVKALAMELVDTIEARLQEMVHWTDKRQTQDEVRRMIRDSLYRGLPESSYPDAAIPPFMQEVYQYFYNRDRAA